ncbi:single-stranded DNA-binding protein [Candidatus Acetothermia bacterium]|nr:MAG: single-stranded DNA-binding protein [Candidatus Acetothermia bacterium]RLE33828.1 MAG: single-stranded DNA-binding protein [Candidatus Acetothermia bacterium]HDC93014.1 single-stranded DNA-binding protein [Candidatus Acetothermia bacterium]
MSDLNRVLLTGRLTADPELRYTQSGQALVRFAIAVNRRVLNPETNNWEEETTYVPVVVWGKLAETCATYLQKGRLVAIDGRLRIRSFTTQEGEKRKVTEVVAQNVHFLGPRPETTPEYEAEVPEAPLPEPEPEEEVPF